LTEYNFRDTYNESLQAYIETFISDERKQKLKEMLHLRINYLSMITDSLLDQHNVNAVMRTSELMGLMDLYNIPYNGELKQQRSVTRGAHQWTNLYEFESGKMGLRNCIDGLRSKNYKIYVASSSHSNQFTPQNVPLDHPLAIILGNEHEGISEEAMELADGCIKIPMYGFTESYNVSVAAALIMYPIVERIRSGAIPFPHIDEIQKRDTYYKWLWHSIKHPVFHYQTWLKENR
jgi:tRNA (guanosine-2'-O-)-methyltransferase